MTSERAEQPAVPGQHSGIPGRALAAQREAMGWSVEQVADQLKLAVRQVIALEAGDYASLPSPAVTRGFVRAYAKILRMDAAPLVALIEMDSPPTPSGGAAHVRRAEPTAFSEVRFSLGSKRPSLPLGWIAGVAVVAVAAAAAWHFGLLGSLMHGKESAPASGSTVVLPAPAGGSTSSTSGTGAPAASASAPETLQSTSVPLISVPSPEQGATPAPAPAGPDNAKGAATPVVTNATTTASAAPGVAPAAAAGPNALVLTIRQDSWVSVTPAKGGKPLVSHLAKAGSTETVNVDEPLKVVVGNAPGVSATLRGAALALPGQTARISVK
jgi:cytoskeleton protein RodZ